MKRHPVLSRFLLLAALAMIARAAAAPAPAPTMPVDAATYAQRVEAELRGDILPFWLKHARDRERGGFFGQINRDLSVKQDAPRGALLTARILWTFSAAYRRYHDPAYLEMARWAYDDLLARFWDKTHGGLYWRIGVDGELLDPRKVIYVQAFGIYGLSEFYRATREQAPLDRAIELYRLMEKHARDQAHGGYFEEFTRDWKISRDRGVRRSAMGSLDQKSQNVHLHLLEAYTNLLRAWPDAGLRRNLTDLTDVMLTKVLDAPHHHLGLFFAEDWTPRSDTISFGHDIEFSWLLVETAEVLGEEALLARARAEAVQIAEVTLKQGVDPDGGVLGEAAPQGLTSTFKEWWPQAEAAVGFFNAYRISGDTRFRDASLRSWNFIETQLVDREQGEWFQGVSRDGRTKAGLKVSFWKCPYHNGRACLELLERLAASGSGSTP